MESKDFPCSSEGIVAAQAFLGLLCDGPKPAIVMDEIVSNIVRCSGATKFSVGLERSGDGLTMVFSDDGKAFDPTRDAPRPDLTATVAERSVGGLGIFMVGKMSKSVAYRRDGGLNVLTVVI